MVGVLWLIAPLVYTARFGRGLSARSKWHRPTHLFNAQVVQISFLCLLACAATRLVMIVNMEQRPLYLNRSAALQGSSCGFLRGGSAPFGGSERHGPETGRIDRTGASRCRIGGGKAATYSKFRYLDWML